jgi:hypothetical protein
MSSIVELIFALEQWLRSTRVTEFALWVQTTALSRFVDGHPWVEPALQTTHILTLSMLFGSVLMIGLRVCGLAGRSRTLTQTLQRYMPVVWWSLLIMVITGAGLILGDVVRNLTSPIFWGKMILIAAAALIGLWFQSSVGRQPPVWETVHHRRVVIRTAAVGAIALWCAIIVAGRLIAYTPT